MIESCAAIVIAAKHHEITKIKDARGTTNTVGALRCRFEFRTSDWDHSAKTAMFCKGDAILHPEVADSAIAVPLDRDNECAVPSEMLTDTLPYSIGVWGVTTSGIRIVSRWLVFGAQPGCYTEGGAPADPEPTMYEQILSASNVAVNVANDVLYRADSGAFDGEDGISIIKSEINNKGELVFTYSDERSVNLGGIIGASGKDGADGKDGYTPIKGVDYFDGVDGKDGHDGKDGYTPVKGVDYFTSADKSLIVADVLSEMPDCDYSTADAILKAELQDDIADAMDRIAALEQSVPASIEIVQEMGESETAVMSQKAVYDMWDSTQNDIYLNNESISNLWSDQAWQNVRHDELAARVEAIENGGGASVEIVQTTGESETAVMSQKASTEAFLPKIPNSTGEEEVPLIMRDNSVVRRAVSMNALPYRLVMRDDFSNAKFGTPQHEQHAATKKYVDDAVANASGGGSVNIVQETGESTTAVMSQKAVTAEIDAQKIKLANIKHFIPNENVLTDNSAKYRKSIPENACPYAEVKKVCGLTQRSKNLLPYPYNFTEPLTVLGVTWTPNANGSITANGTQTTSGSVPLFVYNSNPIFFNGTYSASLGVALPTGCTLYLHFLDDLGNVNIIDGAENGTKTISNRKCDGIRFWISSGTVFNNVTFFPMINEGSVALPYTQYFDGFRDSAVTEIRSEHGNLVNFENVYPTFKGENGKIIKRSGAHNIDLFANTTGGNTVFPIEYLDKLIYLKAGTYYLYYNYEEEGLTDYTMTVLGVEESGKVYGVGGSQITSGMTFKPTKDCYITLRVGGREQITITNLMITTKPQTDYIPYSPDIITIPEEIQALDGYGIGKSESENNYIDFEKKVFHKEYGKIRLLSTMGGYNAENNWYYLSVGELGVAPIARDVLCNALPSVDIPANAEADGAYFNPSMSHLLLRKSEFTTQAEYRQWLADNEVYIVEKLATPVVTDVSQYLTEDNIINVEDGVFINAVNANELDVPTTVTYVLKLEVENKYVPIQQTTSTTSLVKQNTGGTVSLVNYTDNANGYTIPYRNGSGTTRFADPTEEKNPVTLGYANEHYVQRTPNTTGLFQVYCNNIQGDAIEMLSVNPLVSNWSIARRYEDGRLRVGTPVEEADATPKSYVDGQYVKNLNNKGGKWGLAYLASVNGGNTSKVVCHANTQEDLDGMAYTIVQRDGNSRIQAADPEKAIDVATKKYVDDAIAALKAELQTYIEQTLLNGEW